MWTYLEYENVEKWSASLFPQVESPLEQLLELHTGHEGHHHHQWRGDRIDHRWSGCVGQLEGGHIDTVTAVAVASEAMLLVGANRLAGDASARKRVSTTQNKATVVGGKGGAQRRSSSLGCGASGVVSASRAGVASCTSWGEDSAVAAWAAHDVHTGLAVLRGGAGFQTLSRPFSRTATDGLSLYDLCEALVASNGAVRGQDCFANETVWVGGRRALNAFWK